MSALEKLDSWGLTFHQPTTEQVRLPADITLITSDQLGELFTRLTAWTDFLASQVAMAKLDERNAKNKLDFTENTMLVKRMGAQVKGERVTAVKAEISVHPDVVSLFDEHEEKYAYRFMLETMFTNHERDLSLVSREITRRSNDARSLRTL
jgi:hypothetical protein